MRLLLSSYLSVRLPVCPSPWNISVGPERLCMLDNWGYRHTRDMQYILLFHGNNDYVKAALCYTHTYIALNFLVFWSGGKVPSKIPGFVYGRNFNAWMNCCVPHRPTCVCECLRRNKVYWKLKTFKSDKNHRYWFFSPFRMISPYTTWQPETWNPIVKGFSVKFVSYSINQCTVAFWRNVCVRCLVRSL